MRLAEYAPGDGFVESVADSRECAQTAHSGMDRRGRTLCVQLANLRATQRYVKNLARRMRFARTGLERTA